MTQPIALVTGASRGLGREVARRLGAEGFTVLAGVRNPASMNPLPGVEVLPLDVSDPASIRAAAASIRARHGRLEVLVNNAGILLDRMGDALALEVELLNRTLETNTMGPLRLIQALAPLMPKDGRIVNVSSGGGQLSTPATWAPAYCISKTALNAVTVQLSEALRPQGIAVNAVCPGWVRTDLGGPEAPRSLQQGADSILWLALQADPGLTGGFWRDGERIPW
ncbi:MAG: SDR family NAD(P)-dependent oxidoreductase [Geothrix sp.]|uniref:SDR family NAD(P)-dependent oxidoreductase n=1 Tax=Geothrix sp. TaxID=1962974 RepID=UPI0017AC25D2|nr:SDR family NAD(P)-dependent oxidoreductase [Geothrix sp.]NWJ40377.1 SDR family NAD(P)-dependent oxidoreductase [Geothrix sp.]WIL21618.1 MAG: SDR family NAD(P)-dependent oxidoreductase [Geothrix sp.]